jgi:hypothetical protein
MQEKLKKNVFYNMFFQHYLITGALNEEWGNKIRYFAGEKNYFTRTYETKDIFGVVGSNAGCDACIFGNR